MSEDMKEDTINKRSAERSYEEEEDYYRAAEAGKRRQEQRAE